MHTSPSSRNADGMSRSPPPRLFSGTSPGSQRGLSSANDRPGSDNAFAVRSESSRIALEIAKAKNDLDKVLNSSHTKSPSENIALQTMRSNLVELERDVSHAISDIRTLAESPPTRTYRGTATNVPVPRFKSPGAASVASSGATDSFRFESPASYRTGYARVLAEDYDTEAGITEPLTTLKESRNVILLFRLQMLRTMSGVNFAISVLTLIYLALNIVLIVCNAMLVGDCEEFQEKLDLVEKSHGRLSEPSMHEPQCGSPISIYHFHMTEFTATFLFSILQAIALLFTPKSSMNIYENPSILRLVLVFAIVVSAIPTLMIWINIEVFEVASHEIEYSNEITMSFIDISLFTSVLRASQKAKGDDDSSPSAYGLTNLVIAVIAFAIALIQLLIYNAMGVSDDGEHLGEKQAHYCEFAFEIISAFITFWFCVSSA